MRMKDADAETFYGSDVETEQQNRRQKIERLPDLAGLSLGSSLCS
jgi:hypothetical protein